MTIKKHQANALIEIGTEELPPKLLISLSEHFKEALLLELKKSLLVCDENNIKVFSTPRRVALHIPKLNLTQPDQYIKKLGPSISAAYDKDGNPSKAAIGFARSNHVPLEDLKIIETDKEKKLSYQTTISGKPTAMLLNQILNNAVKNIPIPKKMRWGNAEYEFIRPVHWLVVMLDDKKIDCNIFGISSSNNSFGHRFHSNNIIKIEHADNYESVLNEEGFVIVDFYKRREKIKKQIEILAKKTNGKAVIDQYLLDEVTGLVENPVALLGSFDQKFLTIPQEALIYSMSDHQKYFHLLDGEGHLLPHFITISNLDSPEPEKIIQGNEKVIHPRLADAAFFFETDKKTTLDGFREKLKKIVFQKELGTLYEKTERIAKLSREIAKTLGTDSISTFKAGQLCKADLASDMVLEFEKMQGLAGYYYALNEGFSEKICNAIGEHYLPKFAGDNVPKTKISSCVAIADRLDTLVGIFGINQEPTGSKDPFALRRASISILQILLQNKLSLNLEFWIKKACLEFPKLQDPDKTKEKVFNYILDRFSALYKDKNISAEIISSVRIRNINDPLDFNARIMAVAEFVITPQCDSLSAANKRVKNMLEKSGVMISHNKFDEKLLVEPAEKSLAAAVGEYEKIVLPLFSNGSYSEGLKKLTDLKGNIDDFFDNVMVNCDDALLKKNRLFLLSRLTNLFYQVADISLLVKNKN